MMTKDTTMIKVALKLAGISAVLLGLAGCGSDGGSATTQQQKTATITFSTLSSPHSAPLRVIKFSAKLPDGVSFSNISTALIGRNDTGTLMSGVYVPSTRIVSFMVMSGSEPIRFGRFAELKCNISSVPSLSQTSFESVNTPFPSVILNSGAFNGDSVDLAGEIPVKLTVTFGY